MAPEAETEPHPEVPEFVVVGLDGHRHPAFNATPRSGVIFQSASITGANAQYGDAGSMRLARAHRGKGQGQRANIGLNFTNLVPQDFSGGSVLCGGLKMVFTALQSSSNFRDDVYRAIEDLPFTINHHAAYIRLDKQDEDLHRRNAALYAALFQLLECILSWFAKNPVGVLEILILFVFSVQSNGGRLKDLPRPFKMKQANVQRAASRFEKHALWLQNQRHNDSIELQHWMAYELFRTREDVSVIRARCEVLESFTQFLQQAHRSQLRETFLRDAEYEPTMIERDVSHILRLRTGSRQELDEDRVCREVAFIAAQVTDMAKRTHAEPTEPTVHIIPLAFFCSEHSTSRRDRLGHPNALIWMLLLQLVDYYHEFSSSRLEKSLAMTADGKTEKVCAAFENLVGHLSSNVIVLLVVEGVDSFLHYSIRRELIDVVGFLKRLPAESQGKCKLKVLCTSTTSSDLLEDIFDEDQILRMTRTSRATSGLRSVEALAGLPDLVPSLGR
ncbi:hypothetical protein PG994_009083 [Apiospora phragmitis]|uniref:Uncharacterized protein n=1 Tax=Apiospora phragmitis TaxID=2905665 RepID=A0ABR1UIA2_9PEZI